MAGVRSTTVDSGLTATAAAAGSAGVGAGSSESSPVRRRRIRISASMPMAAPTLSMIARPAATMTTRFFFDVTASTLSPRSRASVVI